MTTTTQDLNFDTWTEPSINVPGEVLTPRLRVLYHIDLDRIGAVTRVHAEAERGGWLTVGRAQPNFVGGKQLDLISPLIDPTISRKQFRVRWLAESQQFEVESHETAKRPLGLVAITSHTGGEGSGIRPIEERVLLPPGSCIAIANRLLLGLEVLESHPNPVEDRFGMIGESRVMWRLRKDISEVVAFKKPVLIQGATGTGKELAANAIHQQGPRSEGPFIVANCAALPEALIESLLFGHRKGAFTGAQTSQIGLFLAADGGTLFLDEIGELPLPLQPKLLRTMQSGEVVPVGKHECVYTNARLITATNRNLDVEVAAGRLRSDLYHRVAGHVIDVPPLNGRAFDIPELYMHFLRQYGASHPRVGWLWKRVDKWRKTIPMRFFIDLMRGAWTGNVRQLENIAERTLRLNLDGPRFEPPDLPLGKITPEPDWTNHVKHAGPPPKSALVSLNPKQLAFASQALDLSHKSVRKLLADKVLAGAWRRIRETLGGDEGVRAEALKETVRERLLSLLAESDYSRRQVASTLKMSPSTLTKIMDGFDLPKPSDLSLEVIRQALDENGDSLEVAARQLCVSPQGLRKQLTLLKLKIRGRDTTVNGVKPFGTQDEAAR